MPQRSLSHTFAWWVAKFRFAFFIGGFVLAGVLLRPVLETLFMAVLR